MNKKPSFLWMRAGDNAEYEKFDSPYDAGHDISIRFESISLMMPKVSKTHYGVVIDPYFTGYNYVSLFWGDNDAQPIKDTSASDIAEFKRGIAEGADLVPRKRASRKPSARRRMKASGPSGLGGVR